MCVNVISFSSSANFYIIPGAPDPLLCGNSSDAGWVFTNQLSLMLPKADEYFGIVPVASSVGSGVGSGFRFFNLIMNPCKEHFPCQVWLPVAGGIISLWIQSRGSSEKYGWRLRNGNLPRAVGFPPSFQLWRHFWPKLCFRLTLREKLSLAALVSLGQG